MCLVSSVAHLSKVLAEFWKTATVEVNLFLARVLSILQMRAYISMNHFNECSTQKESLCTQKVNLSGRRLCLNPYPWLVVFYVQGMFPSRGACRHMTHTFTLQDKEVNRISLWGPAAGSCLVPTSSGSTNLNKKRLNFCSSIQDRNTGTTQLLLFNHSKVCPLSRWSLRIAH